MANRSILTMNNGQVQAQSSSDNIVLNAPLNVAGSPIFCGIGDIILVPTANDCIVGGSGHTTNQAVLGFVGGGANGVLQTSNHGFIGAGIDCRVLADDAVVLGGNNNDALSACSVVCGGQDNTANATYAAVLGGKSNLASGNCAIAGGESCNATGAHAISLGKSNVASGNFSTIPGGHDNIASGQYSVACGASCNATGEYSAAFGLSCVSSGNHTFTSGRSNTASGTCSAVPGGFNNNVASGCSCIAGGQANVITAGSDYAAILGGYTNNVNADFAVACGIDAVANFQGTFVHSGGKITTAGDAQVIRAVTCVTTTSNNASDLYLDGNTKTLNLIQPPDTVWCSKVLLTGMRSDGAQGASYYFIYTTRRDGTANAVATTNGAITNPYALVMTEDDTNWNAAMNIRNGTDITASAIGTNNASATYYWVAVWEITQVGCY